MAQYHSGSKLLNKSICYDPFLYSCRRSLHGVSVTLLIVAQVILYDFVFVALEQKKVMFCHVLFNPLLCEWKDSSMHGHEFCSMSNHTMHVRSDMLSWVH